MLKSLSLLPHNPSLRQTSLVINCPSKDSTVGRTGGPVLYYNTTLLPALMTLSPIHSVNSLRARFIWSFYGIPIMGVIYWSLVLIELTGLVLIRISLLVNYWLDSLLKTPGLSLTFKPKYRPTQDPLLLDLLIFDESHFVDSVYSPK